MKLALRTFALASLVCFIAACSQNRAKPPGCSDCPYYKSNKKSCSACAECKSEKKDCRSCDKCKSKKKPCKKDNTCPTCKGKKECPYKKKCESKRKDCQAKANSKNPYDIMACLSEQELMTRFEEASTPGADHMKLEPLVGEWKVVSKWWKVPGEKPEINYGQAKHEWVLGKRFIKEDYRGAWSGQRFQGMGTIGYDNVANQYVSTWMDTMGTGMMKAHGEYNPRTKTIEFEGTYNCPLVQDEVKSHTVTRIINDNKHVFEMYSMGPDGKEFKTMEIIYTRAG